MGDRGHRPARRPDARAGSGRVSAGRVAAARALCDVDEGRAVDDALAAHAPAHPSERGMSWHLALGVLRRRASVDAALRAPLSRGVDGLDPAVRAALRIGAFEILHGGTAPHAAVDQGVEVARALGAGRASGLVNAVLRRVAAVPLSRAEALEHPSWLIARWDAAYGAEVTEAWCRANASRPPLCVVARDDAGALADAFAAAGHATRPATAAGVVVPGVLRLEDPGGRLEALPGYDAGAFWVQDAASVAVADLVPAQARTVLDACAAPGGKTLRLASRGADVTSVDVSAARLARLVEARDRCRLPGPAHAHDWTTGPHPALGLFDAVLVDAPCTGLGTVRRRPDIRWRRGPGDPADRAVTQGAILDGVAAHVRPGGHLVYAVCSAEPEEGPGVVDAFLSRHGGWERVQTLCTAPPQDDEDAFQGFVLRSPEASR